MKRDNFDVFAKNLIADIQQTIIAGQKEYAHGAIDNVFNNFERLSSQVDIAREHVLWVFLSKHLDGIIAYINGHKSQRENVRGRIMDAIVYLIILAAMTYENEGTYSVDNNSLP